MDAGGRAIQALSLNVRVQIRAELRRYSAAEAERLWELFGPVEQWGRSLGPVPWARLRHQVGSFQCSTTTELHLPASFESGAAAPKYLVAIDQGFVPLELLFSGTLSWDAGGGQVHTAMIPWDREASFRMPVEVWRGTEAPGER